MVHSCRRQTRPNREPKGEKLNVKVPAGKKAGDRITVNTPSGERVQVEVPEGCRAGDLKKPLLGFADHF